MTVIDKNAANEATGLGESDHDKKMAAVAEGKEVEPTPPSSEEEYQLPEKFKSVSELVKSYEELSKQLGKPKDESTDESNPSNDNSDSDADKAPSIDQDKFTKELQETGTLSEASYEELAKSGINKDTVDFYIKATQEKSNQETNAIYDIAGGEENYGTLATWAVDNVDKSLVDNYDKAVSENNIPLAKELLKNIKSAYDTANGVDGSRVSGASSSSSRGDIFTDWSQVTAAMNDPRYKGLKADKSYIKSVEEKISRSNLL